MSVDHVDHECLVPLQTFHTEHALKPVPEFTSSFLMSWFFFLNTVLHMVQIFLVPQLTKLVKA